jgi:hypothetical protein
MLHNFFARYLSVITEYDEYERQELRFLVARMIVSNTGMS